MATALSAVGGSFDDVAKLTLYIVDWTPRSWPPWERCRPGGGAAGADLTKPVTLIRVAALGEPDLLVEVDAIAVLP